MFIGDLCPIFYINKVLNQLWLHLFVSDSILPNSKSAISLIDKLNTYQQGSRFICLDSFLSFGVLYKAICDWIRLLIRFQTA